MVSEKVKKVGLVLGTVGASLTPALAFAEDAGGAGAASGDISGITTAIVTAATTIQTSALSMIGQVLPVLAPITAALIIVRIGWRTIRQGSK